MRVYGQASTGTGQADGPNLTCNTPTDPPPKAPIRPAGIGGRDKDNRRIHAANAIRARLKAQGKAWRDARAWALATGEWPLADLPAGTVNIIVADAYPKHPRACPVIIPWPTGWEQDPRIDDGHAHNWEMVVVTHHPGQTEAVTRCATCHAPRCGSTFQIDPCMERRHHDGLHIHESGRYAPVGGYLP